MKNVFILIIFITLLTSFSLGAANSKSKNNQQHQIFITDSKANQTIQISEIKQRQRFEYFWSQKQPIKKLQSYHWQYQLKIKNNSNESKWVYDPKGFAREVTLNNATTIYQVSSARSLNRFLKGILNRE